MIEDFERDLARYRPVGPPPALRETVLAASRTGRLWWVQLVAALAMLIVFYGKAAVEQATINSQWPRASASVTDQVIEPWP